MNIQIAKNRVYQVMNVDSINNEACDFMATHIPFRNISYKMGINDTKKESINEKEVFGRLFEDPLVADKHQFIIVEGPSGSGKSHFIRWLYTKLLVKDDANTNEVVLIRRSENTLKGTIKQLLGIDAIQNLKNKDVYERLVKANTTISDTKFKEEIFAKFIVEINVSEDDILSSLERKRLVALLNNDLYKSKIMEFDGPIERIFSKISNNGVVNIDLIAEFKSDDFIISTEFFDEMRNSADQKAISIAKDLVSDNLKIEVLDKITKFLNSKVENVIQSCAGIEPGDFQQIFKEIRQEFFKQGKNLILLIEDITSFTGINRALLNALLTEHSGLYVSEKMCKLISVVGTTDEYFRTFRDNYKDRITSFITIEDGAIGKNKEDRYLFFAKYLNTVSLTKEQLDDWRITTGASEEEMPIHVPDVKNWESISNNNKDLSLYPFTKKAIDNLYDCMEKKTPRYMLLDIIKPAIEELFTNKSLFLKFLKYRTKPDLGYAISRITSTVNSLNISDLEEYLKRAITFISFWGNGSLTKTNNKIAGIPKSIFVEFGFEMLWDSLIISLDEVIDELQTPDIGNIAPNIQVKQTNEQYDKFMALLDNWYYKKAFFADARYLREELNDFIFNTINWQQYGISKNRVDFILNSGYTHRFVSFARQDKVEEKGLLSLDDSRETYNVLQAIGQWIYLGGKSWNFIGSHNAIYILTAFLECKKNEIIAIVKNYKDDEVPNYIKIAIATLVYEKILNKQIHHSKTEEFTVEDILNPPANECDGNTSEKWNNLLDFTKSKIKNYTYNIILDYFSLKQGSADRGHKFLDYYMLEKTFNLLKRSKFELSQELLENLKYKEERDVVDYYKKLMSKIALLINDEDEKVQNDIKNIYEKFEWPLSDEINAADLRELLDDIAEFYKKAEQSGFIANLKQPEIERYKEEVNSIAKNIKKLIKNADCSSIERFLGLSNSDSKLVKNFSLFLTAVEQDIDRLSPSLEKEKDILTKQGKWVDVDPRFSENEILKDDLVSVVEE